MKLQHLKRYLQNARSRARRDNVPFNLILQDLVDIATDECPIFRTPFVWGSSGLGKGKVRENTPQLDRINPELGYVKGNIAFLSGKANKMKDNGTMQDHYNIADWIWNHTHAKQNTTSPVPTGDHRESEDYSLDGFVLATGARKNGNDFDHHSGAIQRQDTDHRPQASSGDSMGRGVQEVESSIVAEGIEATWPREPKIIWIKDRGGRIPD